MNKPTIAVLCWEKGKVPQGLMQLEKLAGNSTNPKSYSYPVHFVEVKGATTETVILHPSQSVLQEMIRLSEELEHQGFKAITTSCGFNAIFQEPLAQALTIPIFTSALLQVPFASTLLAKNQSVGIITANSRSLTEKHLKSCGITPEMKTHVIGLEKAKEWRKIFDQPEDSFDMELVTEKILGVAKDAVDNNPDIGAFVLECTDLPPFAKRLRGELQLPVFDFNSMMNHVAQAINLIEPF